MPFCTSCSTDNPSDARFCRNCGTDIQSIIAQSPLEPPAPPEIPAPPAEKPPVFCSKCGSQNPPDARFCLSCGAGTQPIISQPPPPQPPTPQIEKPMVFCAKCGTKNLPDARFCLSCGSGLQTGTSTTQTVPQIVIPLALSEGWLRIEDVQNSRERIIGIIGAFLVLIGAFSPWSTKVTLFVMSSSEKSPIAFFIGLAGICAGAFIFRKKTANIVMAFGIGTAAIALIYAIGSMNGTSGSSSGGFMSGLASMASKTSPAWGVWLTIIAGAIVGYSGYTTKVNEGE